MPNRIEEYIKTYCLICIQKTEHMIKKFIWNFLHSIHHLNWLLGVKGTPKRLNESHRILDSADNMDENEAQNHMKG